MLLTLIVYIVPVVLAFNELVSFAINKDVNVFFFLFDPCFSVVLIQPLTDSSTADPTALLNQLFLVKVPDLSVSSFHAAWLARAE